MTFFIYIIILMLVTTNSAMLIKGSVSSNSLSGKGLRGSTFKYLNKFGVMKGSPVYMYGTAMRTYYGGPYSNAMLVFVPSTKWKEYQNALENLEIENWLLSYACNSTLMPILVSNYCVSLQDGEQYIRTVPCSDGKNCIYQPQYMIPPDNSQFLFEVLKAKRTEFWYTFFVFCSQNRSNNDCNWKGYDLVEFNYDFYIVNENPRDSDHNPFVYQFPDNELGFLITYMIFAFFYAILIPTHVIINLRRCRNFKTHTLLWLFTTALIFEAANISLGLVHYAVYASDGYGVPSFNYMKEAFNLIGNWFLIIVLVLIAGGWMVTIKTIKWKLASFLIIFIYVIFTGVYYVWSLVYPSLRPWETNHPLQTWAGGIYLVIRGLLVFYVWYQIYHIYRQEETLPKLRLYKVLCVIFTIWFWYLPVFVIIATIINPVLSWVVLVNVMNAMNFITNLIMAVLFCPKWSNEYFQFENQLNKTEGVSLEPISKKYSRLHDDYTVVL